MHSKRLPRPWTGSSTRSQPSSGSREELALFSDLLEALYAGSGPFALRQLAKIPAFLEKQGVELADYGDDTAEMFELLPSRNPAMTQRPALLAGDRLLVSGKATEQVN